MNANNLFVPAHFYGRTGSLRRALLVFAWSTALLASANSAQAAILYADGSKINLAAGRATTYSSANSPQVVNPAELVQWPAYPGGDYRFGSGFTAPAAMTMDFGSVYNVSEYYFNMHSVFQGGTANFNFQTSTDGVNFTTQQTYNGAILGSGADTRVQGTLATPVDARYVRIDAQSWTGWSQFIITKAQVYGDNSDVITTRGNFSIAQSASNDGVATLRDRVFAPTTPAARPALNDDGESPATDFYGKVLTNMRPLSTDPSQVIVALNDAYTIDRVGFTSIMGDRSWKDVEVWTSPDAAGTNWFKQLTLSGLPMDDPYQDFTFAPVQAQRVRFDVLSDNGTNVDTYGAEVYVYAAPASPAVLDSNPGIGGTISISAPPTGITTIEDAVTLTNIGGEGSFIDVTGYTITPGWSLLNFEALSLVAGLNDSVSFDLAYNPLLAAGGSGQLTFFTSIGEVTFQLAVQAPEPSTALLLGLAVGPLAMLRRRRRAVQAASQA